MKKKTIAALCAAVLTASLFAGCGGKDARVPGAATDATATDAAAAVTGGESGADAGQASSAVSSGDVSFPAGGWEDDVVRFEFYSDGSGYLMYKSAYDGDSLTYEAVDENSVMIRFGSGDGSEEATYEMPDESTLVLTFAGGQTYTLTSADVFTFPTSGTWENENVSYVFREDYSGAVTDRGDSSAVDFEFDVISTDYVIFLMTGDNKHEIVGYELADADTLLLTFADGTDVRLQRAA